MHRPLTRWASVNFVASTGHPVTVTTIQWADLGPAKTEEIIAGLLVRTVPGAKPVDGAGGDDGADVVAPVPGGEHVYQVKSFTGRLTPSWRRQIRSSLRTARDRRPRMRAWTLVLPIDLTPGEQRWFEETLSAEVDIPTDWIGRIELEARFAERPDLARNLLPGSAQQLALQMLIAEDRESAALAKGVPDAVARGEALRDLLGKVDPDWDFDLDLSAGQTTVNIRAKDPGAFTRSPILGSLQLGAVAGTPRTRAIDDFQTFGTSLHLDSEEVAQLDLQLPAGLTDLVADPKQLLSLSIDPVQGPTQRLQMLAVSSGKVVRRLAVVLAEASQGPRGGRRLLFADDAAILYFEFRVPPDDAPLITGGVDFRVSMRPDRHPHDALPAIEFLCGLSECDELRLDSPGQPAIPVRLPNPASSAGLAPLRAFLAQLQALQRVQDATGDSFGVPVLTPDDAQMLHFADELLAHDEVNWPWPGAVVPIPTEQVRSLLATAPLIPKINISGSGGEAIPIAGHSVKMPGKIVFQVTDAVVTNAAALSRAIMHSQPSDVLDVQIGRHQNTVVVFRLARPTGDATT